MNIEPKIEDVQTAVAAAGFDMVWLFDFLDGMRGAYQRKVATEGAWRGVVARVWSNRNLLSRKDADFVEGIKDYECPPSSKQLDYLYGIDARIKLAEREGGR